MRKGSKWAPLPFRRRTSCCLGLVGADRESLGKWVGSLPSPWGVVEASIFTGWVYTPHDSQLSRPKKTGRSLSRSGLSSKVAWDINAAWSPYAGRYFTQPARRLARVANQPRKIPATGWLPVEQGWKFSCNLLRVAQARRGRRTPLLSYFGAGASAFVSAFTYSL